MDYDFCVAEQELRQKAIRFHHRRYEEVGFYRKGEEDLYESASIYFAALHRTTRDVVGVTRLIISRLDDLPTIKYFEIKRSEKEKLGRYDERQLAEISAFTKMPAHDVGMGLIRTALQYSLDHGFTHWVCCIDERVYNYMHRMFKFPFYIIGTPQVYLGSTTIPCVLNLQDCLDNLKLYRMALYDILMRREYGMVKVGL